MNRKTAYVFIAFLVSAITSLIFLAHFYRNKSPVDQYFDLKNNYKLELKGNKNNESLYLNKLTESLKIILGKNLLKEEPNWKISLETLDENNHPEGDYLDGLIYRGDENVIFITNEEIILKRFSEIVKTKDELKNYISNPNFQVNNFDWDFSVTKVFDIKLDSAQDVEFFSAFAGWKSIGMIDFNFPSEIYVSVFSNGKIYFFQNSITFNNEIPECQKISDEGRKIKKENSYGVYTPEVEKKLIDLERENINCYSENIKNISLYSKYKDIVRRDLNRIIK